MKTITFLSKDAGASVTVRTPGYGYEFTLKMAFKIELTLDGKIIAWDNNIENDIRICAYDKHFLNATDQKSFEEFFDYVRGDPFYIVMGYDPTDFYPFGADFGDRGDILGNSSFEVTTINPEHSGVLRSPWLHFNNPMVLSLVAGIDYTVPTHTDQGTFYINNIGLHHPQSEIPISKVSGLKSSEKWSGGNTYVDNGKIADYYTCNVKLQANAANMAVVIHEIQNVIRSRVFEIKAPKNVYLFGRKNVKENGDQNIYQVRLLSNEIKFAHVRFNKFEFELPLLMVGRS